MSLIKYKDKLSSPTTKRGLFKKWRESTEDHYIYINSDNTVNLGICFTNELHELFNWYWVWAKTGTYAPYYKVIFTIGKK